MDVYPGQSIRNPALDWSLVYQMLRDRNEDPGQVPARRGVLGREPG